MFHCNGFVFNTRMNSDLTGAYSCGSTSFTGSIHHSYDINLYSQTSNLRFIYSGTNLQWLKIGSVCNVNATNFYISCNGNTLYHSRKSPKYNDLDYGQFVCVVLGVSTQYLYVTNATGDQTSSPLTIIHNSGTLQVASHNDLTGAYNGVQTEIWFASPVYELANSRNMIFILATSPQFSISRTRVYATNFKPTSMECTSAVCALIGYSSNSVLFTLINGTDMTPVIWKTLSVALTRGSISYSNGRFYISLSGTPLGNNTSIVSALIDQIDLSGLQQTYNCYEWNLVDPLTISYYDTWSYSATQSTCCTGLKTLYNLTYYVITEYERYGAIDYYLMPNYQMTDTNGNRCIFRNPYIYSDVNLTYYLNASSTYVYYTYTYYQEQGAPYKMTVLNGDGTTLSTPSIVVTPVYALNSYYLNDPNIANINYVYFYPHYTPVFYTPTFTFQLNFQTTIIDTVYPAVQDNYVNLTVVNDPFVINGVPDQYASIGYYHYIYLNVQTGKTMPEIIIGCRYQNLAGYGSCYRLLSTDDIVQIYETSSIYSGQSLQLQIYMYYFGDFIRLYNFTLTYDSTLGFVSPSSSIIIQMKVATAYTVTMPVFNMHGGGAAYYTVVNPSAPFTVTIDPSTRIMSVSGLTTANIGVTYYNFKYIASDSATRNSTATVYVTQYNGGLCPWFTVVNGTTMTYNYITTPTLSGISLDTTNCKVMLTSVTNTYAGVYNITIYAYDGTYPLPGEFTYTLTLNANQGPHNVTYIANQSFKSNTASIYNITVPSGMFVDPESDPITYAMTVSPSSTFLSCSTNCTKIVVTNPANSNVGNYTVSLVANDGHPDTVNGTMSFNLEITLNTAPSVNNTISNVVFNGNRSTSYSFGSNLFYDSDGDSLTYSYIINPTASFLTVNLVSMSMSGFAANSNAGVYNITIIADDNDPETPSAYSSFNCSVITNQPPQTTQIVSNLSSLVLYPVLISWDISLFSDINGDSMMFLITTNATGSWYTISNTNLSLIGTPTTNSLAGNFTVTLKSYDSYGAQMLYNVGMNILPNYPPAVNQTWPNVINVVCLIPWQLNITYAFYEPNGESMTFTVDQTWLSIDSSLFILSGTHSQVTDLSTTITITAFDPKGLNGAQTINILLKQNMPPAVLVQPISLSCIAAHSSLLYTIPFSNFKEPENETLYITYTTDKPTMDSWILISENSTHFIFSGIPTNAQIGNYTVTFTLSDGHPEVPKVNSSFVICIILNQAPALTGVPTSVSNDAVGVNWTYLFDKSWFIDVEGDTIYYTCSYTLTPAWISCSQNSTHVIFQGLPNSNGLVQSYIITIVANNSYTDVANTTWTKSFSVTQNYPPVIGAITNQTIQVPFGLTWSFGSTIISDPEGLSLTGQLEVDGSTTIPTWLICNLSTFDFTVVSTNNSLVGVYNVAIVVTDAFNPSVSTSFTITILRNFPPVVIGSIKSTGVVNYDTLAIHFKPIDELFQDPEGAPMTAYVSLADGNVLPSFLVYNSLTNTLSGTPIYANVGDWPLNFTAVDNMGQTASISFLVSVRPCYYKCTNCTENDYNKCTGCKSGYYLYYFQCVTSCIETYFGNNLTQTCDSCHSYCVECKDSTQFNCQKCVRGLFYLNNGCYLQCPDGYYGDTSSFTCKLCDSACTKCYGPTKNECNECNSTLLYIKSGESHCKLAQCIRGFYLNYTDLLCYECDAGCISCDYPNNHYCNQCNQYIYKMMSPGTCTYCNDITGYSINDFGICSEICGDGLNLGQYECDDGNLLNGDGCSNTCKIETGYTCKGTICWEIVRPKANIVSVSLKNLATIKFSEPVVFQNFSQMSASLKANINGPNSPYLFNYTIENTNNILVANKTFTQMKVQIFNIQSSIFGSGIEKIELWFNDTSILSDVIGNKISEGKIVGNLNYFEYIPPAIESSVSTGGQSMEYTLMTMFSINMLLKIVISSSASIMWSLIHVLQLFRYILYINVGSSSLMSTLVSYLAIVVGDIGDYESYLPDVLNEYLLNSTVISKDQILYQSFIDNGYESPFLIEIYSK